MATFLFRPRHKTPTSKAASVSLKQSFALQAFYTLLVSDLDFPPTKASKYPSLIFFFLPPGLLPQCDHPYTISSPLCRPSLSGHPLHLLLHLPVQLHQGLFVSRDGGKGLHTGFVDGFLLRAVINGSLAGLGLLGPAAQEHTHGEDEHKERHGGC